jgi:hypothetical protein
MYCRRCPRESPEVAGWFVDPVGLDASGPVAHDDRMVALDKTRQSRRIAADMMKPMTQANQAP